MLAEFLLTPDVFADDGRSNIVDVVRGFRQCLFPARTVPNALICKLGGQEWEDAVSRKIARIANPNHRQEAMDLFLRMLRDICVSRPEIPASTDDEAAWVSAGVASASLVPLDKIVVSPKSTCPAELGVSVKEFLAEQFWEKYENPRIVDRRISDQEKALRTICAHSDWLLLRMPQIRGGSDDEIVTVKQIIKLSSRFSSAESPRREIDLHIREHQRIPIANLVNSVAGELAEFATSRIKIRLTIWPEGHILNRELLGGKYAEKSRGDSVNRAHWWITMTHVAIGRDGIADAGEEANTWSLFSWKKAHDRLERIRAERPVWSELLN